MAEILEDDGLFAEEERRRQEQERLNAEQQYQPRPEPEPDPDTAIYPVVAQAAGYVYADEWGGNDPGQAAPAPAYQDNGYEETTPTGDGWQPYEQDQQPWAHEQADEYNDPYAVDPFGTYQAPNYEENAPRLAQEYVDPYGNAYQADPNARHASGILSDVNGWYVDEAGNKTGEASYDPFMSGRKEEQLDLYFNEYNKDGTYVHNPGIYQGGLQENRNAWYGDLVADDTANANERLGQIEQRGIEGKKIWQQDQDQRQLEDQGSYNIYEDQERVQATGRQPLSQVGYPWQAYDNTPLGSEDTGSTRYADLLASYRLAQRNRSGKDRTFAQDNGLTPEEFNLIVGSASANPSDQKAWEERWNSTHGNAPRGSIDPRLLGTLSGDRMPSWGDADVTDLYLSSMGQLGDLTVAFDSFTNQLVGRPATDRGALVAAMDLLQWPVDRVKNALVASAIRGNAPLGGYYDPTTGAIPKINGYTDDEAGVQQYLLDHPGENAILDLILGTILDVGPVFHAAGAARGAVGRGAGRAADRAIQAPRIDLAGIGATQTPATPFPHEKLSGLGVPEVRQPVAPDPRFQSRFLPTNDYPMVDVPQQPKPPLAYEQPQASVPARSPQADTPVAPRATTEPLKAIAEPQAVPDKPPVARPRSQQSDILPGDFDYDTVGSPDSGHPYLADYRNQETVDYQARIARTNPSARLTDPETRTVLNDHIVSGFDREKVRNTAKQGDVAEGTRWEAEKDPYVNPDTGMTREERLDYLLGDRGGDDLVSVPHSDNARAVLVDQIARADSYVKELDRIQRSIDNYGAWDIGDGKPHWEGGTGSWRSGMIKRVDSQIEAVKRRALNTPKYGKDKAKLWGRYHALKDFKKSLTFKRTSLKEFRQEFRERQRIVSSDINYLRQTAGDDLGDLEGVAAQRVADLNPDRGFINEPDINDQIEALGRDRYADNVGDRVPVNGQYDRLGRIGDDYTQTYADMPTQKELLASLRAGDVEHLDRVGMGIESDRKPDLQRKPVDYYPTSAEGPRSLSDDLMPSGPALVPERAMLERERIGSTKQTPKERNDPRLTEAGGVARVVESRRKLLQEAARDRIALRKKGVDTSALDTFIDQLKRDLGEGNAAFEILKSRDRSTIGLSVDDFTKRERARADYVSSDLVDREAWGFDRSGLQRPEDLGDLPAYYEELLQNTPPIHRTDFGDLGDKQLKHLSAQNRLDNAKARAAERERYPKAKPEEIAKPAEGMFNDKKQVAATWLKNNANNFAVAPAAAVNMEQDDEDPNRGLKLMAGLVVGGGVGAAAMRRGYLKKLKVMEDTLMPGKVGTAGLTPVQKRWLRLDTQRSNIAAAVGVDIKQRIVQSGLKLDSKFERTKTLNALRVYIDSGKFYGMVESMTEASILRDKQIRNVFNKIRVELKQELPKIINDHNMQGLSTKEQLDFLDRRIIAATDSLMVEHVGKSIRGPVVALSEVVQRASAALVLKYNPKFAVVNTRDGLVQQGITTTLGSAGFQKQGRNIRAIERAYGEADSAVFGPAYIDQEIASQVLNTKEGIDRFNPILNITTGREVRVKTTLFQRHYDNYFTTAIAKELGLNESSWSILGNPWNNPTAKVPLNRLQGLPYKVREEIKGTKSLEEVRAIISRNNIQGKEAKDLIDIFASHQNDARAYAHAETAVQMRDYSQRSNLDTALSVVYPFHYWTTRGPEWQIHMAKRYPLAVSALAVGSLWVMHENKDVPLKDKLGIDIPVGWMLDQMPMSSAMREQVNEGLAWYMGTQNKQHDLHIGLLNWLAEPVMNTIKGSNTDNLRNLVDITDPINMALAAEKLFGYKGRSMAWNIPEAMLRGREDKLPDWLREAINSGDSMYTPKDVPKGKYYPGIAGAGGSVVRAVAESKGLGAIPQAVNQTLYGNATSPGEKKGIDYQKYANKLPDDQARKAYFGESGKKAAVALAGVQPVQYDSKDPEVNMPAAAKPGATTGQRYEDAPGSYDYDEAPNLNSPDPNDWLPQDPEDKAAYAAFVKQHGKPPADGTKESTAYWKLWGEQVAHYTPRDTTESDKKKAATAIRDRYKDGDGNIPDDAWVRIEEEQFNRGLPVDGDRNKGLLRESPEDIRDGLNQIRGVTPEHDKQAGEAWTRERVRDINSWVEKEFQRLQTAGTPKSKAEIRNQPLPWLGGNTIYEWQKKYDPNYDPNFYTPTGDELVNGGTTGAGMLTGINTANNQLMNGKDGDDKPTGSTAQYNSIWNTAFGFQDGSKAGQAKMEAYLNAPYGNTGQTRRQWADQHKPKDTPSTLTNVGAPIPSSSSSPVTSPTTSSPKVGSGATSSPSASVGAKSVSYVSTARPATTAPRAVSTPAPRTSAPASTSAPKTQTSGSPFQNWIAREKPERLQPATTGPTTNQTSGATTVSSAKQTAQAWTAWEGFYKEGKTSTAEAIPILERHVSTGGDPGPYVRRAKYQVYELIRNYQGVDRKSGDSQRGKWFAEVKALPDNVEGMKKLAAIEKLARKR